MSRSLEQDRELNRPDEARTSARTVSAGAGHAHPQSQGRRTGRTAERVGRTAEPLGTRERLARAIDHAAAEKPTMGELISRLEKKGVTVLPSVKSGGRLNGLSYRFEGTTYNGSALGRAYTAHGLQQKRGVAYDTERDRAALERAVKEGGMRLAHAVRDDSGRSQRESRIRSRETGLTPGQQEMLADIGKFRTVASGDLIAYRYGGNVGRFEREMRELAKRGLVESRPITHGRPPKSETIVTLTTAGRTLLRRASTKGTGGQVQQYHAGFVKPSEISHDIGIYRMYQQEAARIEREGGTIQRVVLDFELKKRMYGELNRVADPRETADAAARKERIAHLNGLAVVNGHVVLPDLRIEYETREHEMAKVDLELATDHYKQGQLDTKRAAGLRIYAPDSSPGSPAHHDPGIAGRLVSF